MVARGTKLRDTSDPAPKNDVLKNDAPKNEVLRSPKSDAPKADAVASPDPALSQRKRKETSRYLLQVDRQTKGSYETPESAEAAGLAIKTRHPIVQVSVYDSVDCVNKLLELPAAAS